MSGRVFSACAALGASIPSAESYANKQLQPGQRSVTFLSPVWALSQPIAS